MYIDGVRVASPSLFSTSSLTKQIIFEKMIPYGAHTLKLEWTGQHDRDAKKSWAASINVDKLEVASLMEVNDESASYAGPWTISYSNKHLGGMAKYTNKVGSSAQLQFEGAKVKLLAEYSAVIEAKRISISMMCSSLLVEWICTALQRYIAESCLNPATLPQAPIR